MVGVHVEVVEVEQVLVRAGVRIGEDQEQLHRAARVGDVHGDVGPLLPAAGGFDVDGADRFAVGGTRAGLDGAARTPGGHTEFDLFDPVQVDRVVGDPAAVEDAADVAQTALGVLGGLGDDVLAVGEVLRLHPGRVEFDPVATGQGRDIVSAPVRVLGLEHPEDVHVVAVTAVGPGLADALAAVVLGPGVGVGVVAERGGDLHVGAVDAVPDRAVLGVLHGHLERDLVAPVEELTVQGRLERDLGRGVARGDRHRGRTRPPLLVRHGEGDVVASALLEGVGRGDLGRAGPITEVPLVVEGETAGVEGLLTGELHGQRRGAGGGVGVDAGHRAVPGTHVVDTGDRRVLGAAEPARAVLQHVQGPVRAELHVHGVGQVDVRNGLGDVEDAALVVEVDLLDPLAAPLVQQRNAVVVLGPLVVRLQLGVEFVGGAAHRGAAARAQVRELLGLVVGVPDRRGGDRGSLLQTGVARRVVDRRVAVERLARGPLAEVVVDVGGVVPDAVRPADVDRFGDVVPRHRVLRPTIGVGLGGVRPVVGQVDAAVLLVDAEPERIAQTHREDLGAGEFAVG